MYLLTTFRNYIYPREQPIMRKPIENNRSLERNNYFRTNVVKEFEFQRKRREMFENKYKYQFSWSKWWNDLWGQQEDINKEEQDKEETDKEMDDEWDER